jgi:ATP-dependent RNA helicase RhlE
MIDKIKQSVYYVHKKEKTNLLLDLLVNPKLQSVLIFTRTKHGANKITKDLVENGIKAQAIHGNKSQVAREDALKNFKSKHTRVLVATDIAARGIDIKFLPYVINYELPRSPKDYIHRIGRTGRAGSEGKAISLITEEDKHHFKVIQKKMKRWVELIDSENIL